MNREQRREAERRRSRVQAVHDGPPVRGPGMPDVPAALRAHVERELAVWHAQLEVNCAEALRLTPLEWRDRLELVELLREDGSTYPLAPACSWRPPLQAVEG